MSDHDLDLTEEARPFVAAILMLDNPLPPELAERFSASQVSEVHHAFAAYLYALTLEDVPGADAEAERHLATVKAAGAVSAAWSAHRWLVGQYHAGKAISAAMRPHLH